MKDLDFKSIITKHIGSFVLNMFGVATNSVQLGIEKYHCQYLSQSCSDGKDAYHDDQR